MSGDSPAELGRQLDELRERLSQVESKVGKGQVERLSLVVFSGSLDRQIAAFTIATAAAASGMEVDMFFTFWGFSALRDPGKRGQGTHKTLLARMFGWMLPRGSRQLPLSQFHMGGLGPRLIRKIMSDSKFASLEELMQVAAELEVNLYACDMSMNVMGFSMEELVSYPKLSRCGAATFIERAAAGKVTMFI